MTSFEDWYTDYGIDERDGCLEFRNLTPVADEMWRCWQNYKREMDMRVENYHLLEKLADGEVISPQPDLPNISSGETAGIVRRVARNVVQNVPNVEITSKFDDDSLEGIMSMHVLRSNIIGSNLYSNDLQQNLFASVKTAFTLGFSCVVPVLQQDAANGWHIKYDPIHYRDVFPEPGCKDIESAPTVFVRRYLTRGEAVQLIKDNAVGWDVNALRRMVKTRPPVRERQSTSHQDKKRGVIPDGYEVITWYTSTGEPFLTFEAGSKMLLRIEKNKHPLKKHPVHFLILEKDDQQPLGKSQVEMLAGRQDFQDLMLNGAMKLWYRNINPSIIGYGTINSIPNLSPGKYTQISNPNAKLEPFEVSTRTLDQYGLISQQNLGSMVNLVGSADQQMAAAAGNGMSKTPQGVEAQTAMVDITTNNYQKAVENFCSRYFSYALTIYFHELRAIKSVVLTADARKKLLSKGLEQKYIKEDGTLEIEFEKLAIEYFVRCVPGSLVELEDEKQLRILNELFIPLSQAMPAMAAMQDQAVLNQAAMTMQYIISKQIELSGSESAKQLGLLWEGQTEAATAIDDRITDMETVIGGVSAQLDTEVGLQAQAIAQLQEQVMMLTANNQTLLEQLGVIDAGSTTPPQEAPAPAGVQ